MSNSSLTYSQSHPAILDGKHLITKLVVRVEHLRLMHAGPTLLASSLSQRFHIIGARKIIRFITRQCVICRRHSVKPQAHLLGQLPAERVSPTPPFEKSGVDYARPFQIKYGHVRKPTIVKAYMCFCLSLCEGGPFRACIGFDNRSLHCSSSSLHCQARISCPICSDHGSNFIRAKGELKALQDLLSSRVTRGMISEFCSSHNIQWKYIPERSPRFGGIWESAVKSVKNHLKRVVSPVKLTFEEFTTVLTQIEACLNSRPLTPVNSPDDDGILALTPGHFLIGKPLASLRDSQLSYRSVSLLKRWHLCQHLVRHFWESWSKEYLSTLNKHKWRFSDS